MTYLRRVASHHIRPRVHWKLGAAYGLVLVFGCGPSGSDVGMASSETGDGTEAETGDPTADFLWAYGGGDQPVLSAPVSDLAGNIFVLVALGATPVANPASPQGRFEVDAVALASISATGESRWMVTLGGPAEIAPAAPVRPIVGPGGDVWVHHGDELIRVGSEGSIKWRTPGISHPHGLLTTTSLVLALSSEGTCFVLPMMEAEGPEPWQELRAIGGDGVERWRAATGLAGSFSGDLDHVYPTQTQSPLVAPDGNVLVGCDTCVPGQIGLARFAASDGAHDPIFTLPAPIDGMPTWYTNLRWDGMATRLNLFESSESYRIFLDGNSERPDEDPPVFSSSGPAWVPQDSVTANGFSLHVGVDELMIDVSDTAFENRLDGASPVAFVEPPGVVVAAYLDSLWPPERGLMLVDAQNLVVLSTHMSPWMDPIPAIGDGFVAYVEADTQRLVAVEAPVERVASGPWPIIGGDPQGTRSAEGQ